MKQCGYRYCTKPVSEARRVFCSRICYERQESMAEYSTLEILSAGVEQVNRMKWENDPYAALYEDIDRLMPQSTLNNPLHPRRKHLRR